MSGTQGADGVPKKNWKWLWFLLAYIALSVVGGELIDGVLGWLVATGGYGLSNAVIGLLALGGSFIGVQRLYVRHRREEAEGDPDPLPAPYDYETQAQVGVFFGWVFLVLTWGGTLAWLVLAGVGPAMTFAPIVGTAVFIAGRMETVHARAMDARRGRPPATTAHN